MDIPTIYVDIDNFCKYVASHLLESDSSSQQRRVRQPEISDSEVMTILIWFHQVGYRTFKTYYKEYVQEHLQAEFPTLPSYNRFIELSQRVLMPLGLFLTTRYGRCTGISFIDTLKNQCQIEHSRHRSVWGGIITVLTGLILYTYLPKKPCLRFTEDEQNILLMLESAR